MRVQYSTGVHPSQALPLPTFSLPLSAAPLQYFLGGGTSALRTEIEAPDGRNVSTNLFTPADPGNEVASAGQVENYKKALVQYATEESEQL